MTKRMLLAAAAAVLVPLAANAGPMKPGKWQVTMDGPNGPRTVERCITQAEADAPPQPPKMKNETCRIEDLKVEKGSVSWRVICPKSGMSAISKTIYEGNAFRGETLFKMGNGRQTLQRTSGKYLGPCGKS